MIHTYSTETIAQQLQNLNLPYSDLIARALTAVITGRMARERACEQLYILYLIYFQEANRPKRSDSRFGDF